MALQSISFTSKRHKNMDSPLVLEPSLLGFPNEVLLNVTHCLGQGGETKRFVNAVGPTSAKAIRYTYLNTNLDYLKYLHDLLAKDTSVKTRRIVSAGLKSWMEVNSHWRQCLDVFGGEEKVRGVLYDGAIRTKEGKELPASYTWPRRVIYDEAAAYDDDEDDDENSTRLKLFEWTQSGHTAITHEDNGLFQLKCSGDIKQNSAISIIVGVETARKIDLVSIPLHTLSYVSLKTSAEFTKVRLMNYYFAYFFLNPALAIDLGATSILECLVERKDVSPTSSSSCGITRFFGVPAQPLILSALIHEDSSAFKYLLSRPDFAVEANYRGQHPLNYLRHLKSCFRGDMVLPDISVLLRRLRTLLRRAKDLDWNSVDSRSNAKGTPLYELLFGSTRYNQVNHSYDDIDVALVDLYLSFGATNQWIASLLPDKTRHQRTVNKLLSAKTQFERDIIMRQHASAQHGSIE